MPEEDVGDEGRMTEDVAVEEIPAEESRGWGGEELTGSVFVETGRGQAVEVQAGAPFVETVERIAEETHYGGYFRVFLNGSELTEDPWVDEEHSQLNPSYPAVIEPGMRIAITSYDKVGV